MMRKELILILIVLMRVILFILFFIIFSYIMYYLLDDIIKIKTSFLKILINCAVSIPLSNFLSCYFKKLIQKRLLE